MLGEKIQRLVASPGFVKSESRGFQDVAGVHEDECVIVNRDRMEACCSYEPDDVDLPP